MLPFRDNKKLIYLVFSATLFYISLHYYLKYIYNRFEEKIYRLGIDY